jgi:hypothetical protein
MFMTDRSALMTPRMPPWTASVHFPDSYPIDIFHLSFNFLCLLLSQCPPPHKSHTVCKYILYIGKGGRGEGGGGQREGTVEGQQYTSIASSSMGATVQFTSWVENTNHELKYLQSIKSVKQNAAKSVNRPTERKADI